MRRRRLPARPTRQVVLVGNPISDLADELAGCVSDFTTGDHPYKEWGYYLPDDELLVEHLKHAGKIAIALEVKRGFEQLRHYLLLSGGYSGYTGRWSEWSKEERRQGYQKAAAGLVKLLERVKQVLSDSPGEGVSLLDAALIINDGDLALAREKKKAWQKLRKPKLPASIGNCPKHSQVKLFAPFALADFVEKTEGEALCTKYKLRQGLRAMAREPRHSARPAQKD